MSDFPAPDPGRIALRVTPPAERALRQGHPWLFESGIRKQSREGKPGDLAVAFDRKGRFLGIGLYDPLSPIRLRVLRHGRPAPIDRDWFARTVERAVALRESILDGATTGCRLLHGEGDGAPGLVVDRYGPALVVKLYSAAWIPHLGDVVAGLERHAPSSHLIVRLGRTVASHREHLHGLEDGSRLRRNGDSGEPPGLPLLFRETGLIFEVDPYRGQKTGFFLDQRENRLRVEGHAQRAGSVLNVFSYTGGFSLYAARGGARRVASLDASRPALEAARRNFGHNRAVAPVRACDHEILHGDAFEQLAGMGREGRAFGMVILDPPSFAKKEEEVDAALASYGRLARLGLRVLRPGGVLVAASCSSRVDPPRFFATLQRSGELEGRSLHEIERTGHPRDHPVLEAFPEGVYLKCLFARAG